MCDFVANEEMQLMDKELSTDGSFVRVHHVDLRLVQRSSLTEKGMEFHVQYDGSTSLQQDVHLAIDRVYAYSIFTAAKKHFARQLSKGGGGSPTPTPTRGQAHVDEGERPETIQALIAIAESYQKVRIKFEGRPDGDGVGPDVMQRALLSDNLATIRNVIARVHTTSGSKKAIFTTPVTDEQAPGVPGLISIISQRNLEKGTSKAQLVSTCPPSRSLS